MVVGNRSMKPSALRALAHALRSKWLGAASRVTLMSVLLALAPAGAANPMGQAPGQYIDVGGYFLHLYCEGVGNPTVILDIGLGGASLAWLPVMERVRNFTRVCTYDRAGYGWSDIGPQPRTSSTIVNELYRLLDSADYAPPYVLVGHSYGGYTAQLFARRYPFLAAGLVLVDSSHPYQIERFAAPPYRLNTAPSSRWGLLQFAEPPEPHRALPPLARLQTLYQYQHWKPRRALSQEYFSFRDSEQELRTALPLPSLPLAVVTRGKRVWPANPRGDRLESLWLALQSELATLSPTAVHLVARASGHQIHLEQPEVVSYAIALIIDTFRAGLSHGRQPIRGWAVDTLATETTAMSWLKDNLPIGRVYRTAYPSDLMASQRRN